MGKYLNEEQQVQFLINVHHKAICDEIHDIYMAKNRDYRGSFHTTFLEEGMAAPRIRMSDKLARFKQLTSPGYSRLVATETVRDTLLDLAGYAILTIMELDDPDSIAHMEQVDGQVSIDDICDFVDPRTYTKEDTKEDKDDATQNANF